ncbi:hypothetical protein LDENG_00060200 [Lucifuga dentata]|nr:hypothetical protein LDENG_00060200 [Lucifuga dentata]
MDVDALLESLEDFEKKGKKETSPLLEQFLCHVAKTGQTTIPWSQFKTYLIFKLEKVIDDFHASTPEQRGTHHPNVEYIPFEEMKERILKIVHGYNGIPFTIQRLCELLTDPRRNYSGTDKFLRGLEKTVMVVSCVYPTSEKNGVSSVNRMNGVMFPGNSLYSDSRNVNGPGAPKSLNRPKLSLSTLLSSNGFPDSTVSKEPEPTAEEMEGHHVSDSMLSESENAPCGGIKKKHEEEEEEEEEDAEADEHEVKRLKFDKKTEDERESEGKQTSCKGSESSSETQESSEDTCGQDYKSGTSFDTPTNTEDHGNENFLKCQTEASEREGEASERGATHSPKTDDTVDQSEEPEVSEESSSFEQDKEESSSKNGSDGKDLPSGTFVSSSSSSAVVTAEGNAYNSNNTETENEPEEHN